ncbi:MAG: biopolymer transporter ExbD [Kiritimatiellia bacterium]
MKRTRRTVYEEAKLDMTPMIDCVFQLLIFFLVSMKFEDIIAHLDVYRPAPDPQAVPQEKVDDLVTIGIFVDGYTINDKPMGLESLDRMLGKLAGYSKTQTILIKCAPDSPHERLIQLLDLCSKNKLQNLSVLSM